MSIDDTQIKELVARRKAAEKVVAGMPDGPMKVKAFVMAFQDLQAPATAGRRKRSRRAPRGPAAKSEQAAAKRRKASTGPQGHLRELVEERYFASPRSLPDIVQQLRVAGHVYKQQDLSTPLRRLTQGKVLRRKQVEREDGRKIWTYEKYS